MINVVGDDGHGAAVFFRADEAVEETGLHFVRVLEETHGEAEIIINKSLKLEGALYKSLQSTTPIRENKTQTLFKTSSNGFTSNSKTKTPIKLLVLYEALEKGIEGRIRAHLGLFCLHI